MVRTTSVNRPVPAEEFDEEVDSNWMDVEGSPSGLVCYPMTRPVTAWRRLFLRAAKVRDVTAENQVTDFLTKRSGQATLSQEECGHPLFARVAGGNRYGRYVHCRVCRLRLSMTPASKASAKATPKAQPKAEPFEPPRRGKAKASPEAETPGKTNTSSRTTRKPQHVRIDTESEEEVQNPRASASENISKASGPMTQITQVLMQVGGAMQQIQASQQRLSALADPNMETPTIQPSAGSHGTSAELPPTPPVNIVSSGQSSQNHH